MCLGIRTQMMEGNTDSFINIVFTKADLEIKLLHWLTTDTTTTGLLIGEDITNYSIKADFFADGGDNYAEVIGELLKIFPRLAFREGWMQGLEVISG